jgi:hypothetical protein
LRGVNPSIALGEPRQHYLQGFLPFISNRLYGINAIPLSSNDKGVSGLSVAIGKKRRD